MRILEVETYGRGGLTHYACNLALALRERGHDVTLVTTSAFELERAPILDAGVRIEAVLARWSGVRFGGAILRKVDALRDALRLIEVVRRLKPDVVHLHCTHPVALLYLRLLRRTGCRVVSTAHVVTPHERMRFQGAFYGRIHRTSDLVIAHSQVDRQRLIDEFDLAADGVEVIPHGDYDFFADETAPVERAEARRRLGIGGDAEVALFFGYVREYKGLDLLLDAWSEVARARPEARLLIVGDPVRLSAARLRELRDQADALGAIHRLEYIPFGDVPLYFAAADVLVMPYRRISQSGVLFLALSLGVPVLATTVGALPEMLEHRSSAYLIPPESTDELATGLGEILGDPGLRAEIARGGRDVADDHSWTKIAERTEAAFTRILADG